MNWTKMRISLDNQEDGITLQSRIQLLHKSSVSFIKPKILNQSRPLISYTVQAFWHIAIFFPSVLDLHPTSPRVAYPKIFSKTTNKMQQLLASFNLRRIEA